MTESQATITFTADRTLIAPGEPVTVRWHVEGVKEVYFYIEGQDWRGHGVAGVAERQVHPTQTTVYRLRVVKRDDQVEVRGIEIHVRAAAILPFGQVFEADKSVVRPGECLTFRWHVEGVREVYFYAEGQNWQEHGVAGVAEQQVCPSQTTIYRLRVVKADGSVEKHGIGIQVRPAELEAYKIITVDRALIQPGECATFRWHVEGVKAVYFYAEGENWQHHGVAGVAEQRVCPSQTTTFCLRVVKADDSLEVHYIAVTVAP
jgi:hypothetical protein